MMTCLKQLTGRRRLLGMLELISELDYLRLLLLDGFSLLNLWPDIGLVGSVDVLKLVVGGENRRQTEVWANCGSDFVAA